MATPYNPFGHSGRIDYVNGKSSVDGSLSKSRSSIGPSYGYAADKEYRKNSHFYINKQGEQKRGGKLFTMADFPGKSPDDLKWPEAHSGKNAEWWYAELRKDGHDPDETIADYIFRMNEPVIKRKRFLAMMLSKKESSNASSSASRRSSKPMSAKRAAYYDEDL